MAILDWCVQILEKFAEDEPSTIKIPDHKPTTNADSESLCYTLKRLFSGKAGKGFGNLLMHAEHTVIGPWIKDWYEEKSPFEKMTANAITAIKERLDLIPVITQSYCIWAHEQQGDNRNLYLFIVESSVTQAVTESLTIEPIEHLNPQSISFAAKFELDPLFGYASEDKDAVMVYLLKQQRKLGEACCQALGFTSKIDTAKETEVVMEGIERYSSRLEPEQAAQLKKRAVEFCADQDKLGEPVALEELSITLDDENPQQFAQFVRSEIPDTPEKLRPDSRKLKQLVRFAGRGQGVSLSFSSDVINQSVVYDENKDTLTIVDVPKSLKAQLKRYIAQINQQEPPKSEE